MLNIDFTRDAIKNETTEETQIADRDLSTLYNEGLITEAAYVRMINDSREDSQIVYIIEGEGMAGTEEEQDAGEPLDVLTYSHAEEQVAEIVDADEGPVTIMGVDYDPSRLLQAVDPVAWRESVLAYMDNNRHDGDVVVVE